MRMFLTRQTRAAPLGSKEHVNVVACLPLDDDDRTIYACGPIDLLKVEVIGQIMKITAFQQPIILALINNHN